MTFTLTGILHKFRYVCIGLVTVIIFTLLNYVQYMHNLQAIDTLQTLRLQQRDTIQQELTLWSGLLQTMAVEADEEYTAFVEMFPNTPQNQRVFTWSYQETIDDTQLSHAGQTEHSPVRGNSLMFHLVTLHDQVNAFQKYLHEHLDMLDTTPTIMPTEGWISSGFGYRRSPFDGQLQFHRGLDIANRMGTSVWATAGGIVSAVGFNDELWGNNVLIDHGNGIKTQFGHLQSIQIEHGATVQRGDIIGTMGMSGRTTAPHLHYQVWIYDVPVNPRNFIFDLDKGVNPSRKTAKDRQYAKMAYTGGQEFTD